MNAPTVHDHLLPYVDKLSERLPETVELAVIHCTELPDLATARAYGERTLYASGTGDSGHYYIDRDGTIWRYVPGVRIAHHVRDHNACSIGIELINRGRYPHWWHASHQLMTEPYPLPQIVALKALLTELQHEFPRLHYIAGHEELDITRVPAADDPTSTVPRKRDPGPLFPWTKVLAGNRLVRYHISL